MHGNVVAVRCAVKGDGRQLGIDRSGQCREAAEGASKSAEYNLEVAVFTVARGGLKCEASVGGQKFSYHAYEK